VPLLASHRRKRLLPLLRVSSGEGHLSSWEMEVRDKGRGGSLSAGLRPSVDLIRVREARERKSGAQLNATFYHPIITIAMYLMN
jgi:hypothetical protein